MTSVMPKGNLGRLLQQQKSRFQKRPHPLPHLRLNELNYYILENSRRKGKDYMRPSLLSYLEISLQAKTVITSC